MSNTKDFHEKQVEHAKRQFAKNTAEHVVEQLHRDGDAVRLWRCGKPGTCVYRFHVCCPPGWMIIYGDMGECMWSRTHDMIAWARSAVDSIGYFTEKVPSCIQVKEFQPELVREWLATVKQDWIESGAEWGHDQDCELDSIRDSWSSYESKHDFERALFESDLYGDCESIPDTMAFSFRYLWQVEAIRWLIGKIDADEVLTQTEGMR